MSRTAHYVKSSAATLGLARVQALCCQLQENSEDNDDRDDDVDEKVRLSCNVCIPSKVSDLCELCYLRFSFTVDQRFIGSLYWNCN